MHNGNFSQALVKESYRREKVLAVQIEFLNMIIPIAVIDKKYLGGWEQYRKDNGFSATESDDFSDGELHRLGAMDEFSLQLIVSEWKSRGLKGFVGSGEKKTWKDYCLFDSFTGPSHCDWLSFDAKEGTVSWVSIPKL